MMGVMPSDGVMVSSNPLEPTPPLTELSALYPSLFEVTCQHMPIGSCFKLLLQCTP